MKYKLEYDGYSYRLSIKTFFWYTPMMIEEGMYKKSFRTTIRDIEEILEFVDIGRRDYRFGDFNGLLYDVKTIYFKNIKHLKDTYPELFI